MKIIVINGSGTSGKDTVVTMVKDYMNIRKIGGKPSALVTNISSVDQIKEIASTLGWNGEKNDKSRKFLSDLKDLSTNYNNGPFKYIQNQINLARGRSLFHSKTLGIDLDTLVFVHIREPEEIRKMKEYYGDDCVTLLIKRDSVEQFSNHADKNVDNYSYMDIINNNGSLKELNKNIITYINKTMEY